MPLAFFFLIFYTILHVNKAIKKELLNLNNIFNQISFKLDINVFFKNFGNHTQNTIWSVVSKIKFSFFSYIMV